MCLWTYNYFSDSNAALLSESKHELTHKLLEVVLMWCSQLLYRWFIWSYKCEILSYDSSRATLGQTLLHAFLHFHDLNKVGSASCNIVVRSHKPETISLKENALMVIWQSPETVFTVFIHSATNVTLDITFTSYITFLTYKHY